jgi:ankyrin repeat protein
MGAANEHHQAIRESVVRGSVVNTIDSSQFDERMLLDAICRWHDPEAVGALLRKGVNPNIHGDDFTALEFAAALPDSAALELMLGHGAIPDFRSSRGSTALHAACSVNAARLLLAAGTAIDAVDHDGMTPLHHAVLRGHGEVIAFLMERQANPHVANARGDTPEDLARDDAATCAPFLAWRARQDAEQLRTRAMPGNCRTHSPTFHQNRGRPC